MSLSTVAQFGQLIPQHPEREAYNVHSWPRKHWINCLACVTPLNVAAKAPYILCARPSFLFVSPVIDKHVFFQIYLMAPNLVFTAKYHSFLFTLAFIAQAMHALSNLSHGAKPCDHRQTSLLSFLRQIISLWVGVPNDPIAREIRHQHCYARKHMRVVVTKLLF